jgi:hypothetical protein
MAPGAETCNSLILVMNCGLISALFGCYGDCKNVLQVTNNTYVSVDLSLTEWLPKASDVLLKCET